MAYGNTVKDGSGDFWHTLINSLGQLIVDDGWRTVLYPDELADDSDKTFTVPANTVWEIMSVWIEYVSTGTAGNRLVVMEIQDSSSDVIFTTTAGTTQAQSLTRYYRFAPHVADLTAFRNTFYLSNPIPVLQLPAGYKIRIYDNAAIAAAADDMVIQMLVKERTV